MCRHGLLRDNFNIFTFLSFMRAERPALLIVLDLEKLLIFDAHGKRKL
jgi:hypothetical protein